MLPPHLDLDNEAVSKDAAFGNGTSHNKRVSHEACASSLDVSCSGKRNLATDPDSSHIRVGKAMNIAAVENCSVDTVDANAVINCSNGSLKEDTGLRKGTSSTSDVGVETTFKDVKYMKPHSSVREVNAPSSHVFY